MLALLYRNFRAMTYRILLAMSGLLMMFAVISLVLLMGAMLNPSNAGITGLVVMSAVCVAVTLIVLRFGLVIRRKMHVRFDAAVGDQVQRRGYIDAVDFAAAVSISLDSARDILDSMAQHRGWVRTEHAGYNARYVVSPQANSAMHTS